jgi:crotonobetainyl-CoA:carnitine CoA-transferase CaiB-like acyl-CoA transferase
MLKFDQLLVVSLEQAVAAPFCSNRLAHAGARVIKIERAEGDFARGYDSVVQGESAYFVWLNQGKESLQLDIKKEEDAGLLHRILAQADVFIQNLAPAAAQRAGFGSEELLERYPRLICCDISGYGPAGAVRVGNGLDHRYARSAGTDRGFSLRYQLRSTGVRGNPRSPDRTRAE